jgi:hypothetical protein
MQESSNTPSSTPNPTKMMVTAVLARSSEIRLARASHRKNHQLIHGFLDSWPKAWAEGLCIFLRGCDGTGIEKKQRWALGYD